MRQDQKNVTIGSPKHTYGALIDTGATATCISPKVVGNLQLLSEGKRPVISATEETSANPYHINLHIPITRMSAASPEDNKSKIPVELSVLSHQGLEVTEITQPDDYDVLLGMDVLERCSLFVSGEQFTFCY